MSQIITFYSYKGGVGRTFALANIGVLMAQRGKRVLLMDWDLEAPGLHRYFKQLLGGALPTQEGLVHLLNCAAGDSDTDWKNYRTSIDVPGNDAGGELHAIFSGDTAADYARQVASLSWADFFAKHQGGDVLERWSREWRDTYDFVLIDSRTGITDSGGVCTVFLPDILVFVFTANEQSFDRGVEVVKRIQQARRKLEIYRPPAGILPLPGRFDGLVETNDAQAWLERFAEGLQPFYDVWLPEWIPPLSMLMATKIQYVPKFSFGEPLPVITHGLTDTAMPGFNLLNTVRLLETDFAAARAIVEQRQDDGTESLARLQMLLAQVPIVEHAVLQALEDIRIDHGDGPMLAALLDAAGVALMRGRCFTGAERCFREAAFGAAVETSSTVDILNHLAELMQTIGRPLDAEAMYRRSLEILEAAEVPLGERAARVYARLSRLLRDIGRPAEAEDAYRRCLSVVERAALLSDSTWVETYMDFAAMLHNAGRISDAEGIYRRAVAALVAAAPNAPALTTVNKVLGDMMAGAGRLSAAVDAYRQSLESMAISAEVDGIETIDLYTGLAAALHSLGRMKEFEHISREGARLVETMVPAADPALLAPYIRFGDMLRQSGRAADAVAVFRNTLVRSKAAPTYPDHIAMELFERLSTTLHELGRDAAADIVLTQARTAIVGLRLTDDTDLVAKYRYLAAIFNDVGRMEEAEELYRECILMLERSPNADEAELGITLSRLGEMLMEQRRAPEAEMILKRALELLEKHSGRDNPATLSTLNLLVAALETQGAENKAREAKSIRARIRYDAFMSYQMRDMRAVRLLAKELAERGVRVWLDEWELEPGALKPRAELNAVEAAAAVIVCIGQRGVIAWEPRLAKAIVGRLRQAYRPVIPVFLPDAPEQVELPDALAELVAVDMRQGMTDQLLAKLVHAVGEARAAAPPL
ncbi:MAG: tetratricopeptide repeat protein [Bacteroidetes bacterium]|nr:tetratricopeptide repeat protein [Bacteroidota bacterium]